MVIIGYKNKKIGIVTLFGKVNYGQNLQAWSMLKITEKLGYSGYLISAIKTNKKKNSRRFIRYIKKIIILLRFPFISVNNFKNRFENKIFINTNKTGLETRNKIFERFVNDKLCICNYADVEGLNENFDFDAFVCGSDQIWNPNDFCDINRGFLRFTSIDKRISYAPSFGVTNIPEKLQSIYRDYIKEIPYLSCRESEGVTLIEQLCGVHATKVLDPTLLLTKEYWGALSSKDLGAVPYVLCYFLGRKTIYHKLAKEVVDKLGYKIITFPFSYNDLKRSYHKEFEVGPLEFVNYIKNASLVLTDSFHGVAFSINLNTPFLCFKRAEGKGNQNNNMMSRINSILKPCGMLNRIVDETNHFNEDMLNLSFDIANSYLDSERQKSLEFLENAFCSIFKR